MQQGMKAATGSLLQRNGSGVRLGVLSVIGSRRRKLALKVQSDCMIVDIMQ